MNGIKSIWLMMPLPVDTLERLRIQCRHLLFIDLGFQVAHQSNLLDQCACFMLNENLLVLLCKFKTEERVDQLKRFLTSCLTEHFQPSRIVAIEHDLPLNTNGKIDREKLQAVYENTVEKTKNDSVKEIWQVRRRRSSFFVIFRRIF